MSKDDWDLRSNIKDKPNAQGTLFSGGASQIPAEKRYPRGYTPDRMAEVTNTVQFPAVNYSHEMGRDYFNRAKAQENIARSTIPASDLQGLTVKVLPHRGHIIGGSDGVYEDDQQRAMVMQHAAGTSTVIHEIGHHVSHVASGGTNYGAGTPRERGYEEGFADRYADEHFRPHPQAKKMMLDDSRRGLDNYEPSPLQTRDRNGRHRTVDFHKGYDAARPMESRVPNETDLNHARAIASMDAAMKHRDDNPTLPGL